MTRAFIFSALKWTGIVFFFLIIVLIVHIAVVTRPHVDASTRVMARIDINQPMSREDADKATDWLYRQKGVDHVLCNPATKIAVFTFSPLSANADDIATRFRIMLHYPAARRYVPTEKEMQGGCPVATTSFTYKTYMFFKRLF